MGSAPAYEAFEAVIWPPTDEETVRMYVPADDESRVIDEHINQHPVVLGLRNRTDLTESRPHLKIPPAYRPLNLTGGVLMGLGKIAVPPMAWVNADGTEYVQVCHLGSDLCGHPGIVHGGLLATLLDEGMARCSFAALPHNIGMTANLSVNYRAPTPAGSYVVLRATTTKVEGRKAWVEGRLETLVGEGETPTLLADATALFISPKWAASMAKVYPVSTKKAVD